MAIIRGGRLSIKGSQVRHLFEGEVYSRKYGILCFSHPLARFLPVSQMTSGNDPSADLANGSFKWEHGSLTNLMRGNESVAVHTLCASTREERDAPIWISSSRICKRFSFLGLPILLPSSSSWELPILKLMSRLAKERNRPISSLC